MKPRQFESSFWSGGDLTSLYRDLERAGAPPAWRASSSRAFANSRGSSRSRASAEQLLEGARRAMRVAQLKEIDRLEHSLAILATVGSTSPYVGLFGTVWGIMSAFTSLERRAAGDARDGRAGHCRSADRHRHGLVRRDPGR